MVSLCYAPLVADRAAEIAPVARDACAGAGVPDATLRYWKRNLILNDCPLLKKGRIAYFCLPAAPAAPAAPAGDDESGPEDAD